DKWFSTGNLTFTVDAYDPNVTSIPPTGSGLDKSSAGLLAQIVSYLDEPGFGPWFTAGWVMETDTIQFNVGGAEAGTHFLQVHVRDLAGNTSARASLKFNVDLQAPTKPAISYAPYTYDTTHEIAWTESTDTGSGVVGYEVQIGTTSGGDEKIAWTSVGNVLALDDDAWSTLGVELEPDGVYYFQLRAVDAVGWTSAVSEVQITVDTVSPVLASGLPTGYGNATPTISAEFTDERSGLSPLRTVLMLTYKGVPKQIDPTKLVGDPAYTAGDLTAKITYTPSAPLSLNGENDGEYTVDMTAYDLAGNESNTLEWKFKVDTTPPTPPGEPYAGNIHDDGTWYVNTLRPTFKWEASGDPNAPDGTTGSGLKEYWFQFGAQSSKPMSNTDDIWAAALVDKKSMDPVMPTPGAQTQQWTPPADLPLAVGVEYAARVKALDNVGNASAWVDPPIIYDPHPPTEVTDLAGDLNSENTRPTFTWAAATDGISGVDGYMVKIRREASSNWDILNMFVDFPDGAAGTLAWQIGFELDLGGYVISVAAQDVAGNKGPAVELDFVVEDITGPVAPVVSRLTPSPTNQMEQQWTWTTPFDAVRYDFGKSIDGIEDPTAWDNVGNTNIHVTNFTEDGTHYVKVRAYDIHNNAGPWSVAASVEIDRIPPGIPTNLAVSSPTSDNTPTWTWTASMGDVASYEVVLDGAVAMKIGNVTEYTPAPIIDGTHSLKVQALDLLGNESGWTDEAIVLVDTTPPERPNAPQTTSPTNNRNPLWTWGVVLGAAKYRVFEDDVDKGFVTEPKYTSDNLAEGTHYLQVTALDALGNESAKSEAGYVVIDLTAPAVPEMIPLAAYTNADEAMFVWTAISDAGTYDLEYTVGTATAVETGITVQKFTLDISAAVDGAVVSGKVRAYDAAGNAGGWSNTAETVVDRTPPTVNAVTTPESPTNNPRPTWEWLGVDGVSGVDYYIVTLGGESPLEIEGESFTPESDLADGEHVLKVKAVDKAGNVGDYLTFAAVVIDTEAPERPNAPQTASPTNNQSPVWTWGAVLGAAKYRVFEDDVDRGFVTEPNYTSDNLAEGTHYLRVTALDALGNESAKSEAGYVVIDLTPPEAPVMKVMPLLTNATLLTFEWSASVDAATYELNYSKNGGVTWDDVPNPTAQSYTVDIADVSDGVAVLGKVRAYDGVGNVSDWSDAVQTIIDRTGPIVTIVTPTEPTTTNKSAFTWKWNATDAGSGVAGYWVSLDGGAALWTTESSVKLTGLSAGTHALTVKAVDRLGNIGIEAQSPVVTVVKAYVYDVKPLEGAYKVNEISTISFKVGGLYDGQVKVFVGATELEAWRIVTISSMSAESKFYVLLDEEVMNPGMMTVGIDVGDGLEAFTYEVLMERSGYGFGRLRPW
ncbi:MAG: Ig-like domain repeat protein, partial [Firmicutes bacterium]|nr:Ig-like domain repeat protein [Bacillota bacterium]